ncbi:tyrosine-type recombinase/integrase [Streptosporangium sandarakinum]|uniref:tyrosine-type recombinase/integrase n=1 Tax=Streptosporangium sandarakinum TaxID=1260955 RepID=UPI0037B3E85F
MDTPDSAPPAAAAASPPAPVAPPPDLSPRATAGPAPAGPTGRDHQLSPAAAAAIERGVPAATRAAYAGDWTRFAAWCAEVGRTALPATPATMAEYATHLAYDRHRAPDTIRRALSAIRTMHALAEHAKPDLTAARKVVAGYTDHLIRTGDAKAEPHRAAAADTDALRALLAACDRTTAVGQRDAALLLLGYKGAARESELVAVNIEHLTSHPRGLEVRLYRGKTKRLQRLAIKHSKHGTGPCDDLCPVRALTTWAATLRTDGRTRGPLFVRIDQHGNLGVAMTRRGRPIGDPDGRLSVRAIDGIIAGAARRAGLSADHAEGLRRQWSGHSLRRGFATAARAAGADPLIIARTGGWVDGSQTLWRYFEEVDRWADSPLDDLL